AMIGVGHVLGAGLDPLERLSELVGGSRYELIFGIARPLGAEAAADIWRDGPHGMLRDVEQPGNSRPDAVRCLSAGPYCHLFQIRVPVGEDGAALDEDRGDALVEQVNADGVGRSLERAFDV